MRSSNYSLLALYMPISVLIAQVFIVETLFPSALPVVLLIASGVTSALAASLYCDFMQDSKSSRAAANIRGGIIILVFFYILASLLRSGVSWKERFLPNPSNVLTCAAAIFTWTGVISFKHIFSARKRFEIYTEMYQGDQLRQALFEDTDLLQNTETQISKAKRNYLIQLILTGILVVIAVLSKGSLPLPLYIFLIALMTVGIGIFGFLEIIRWEQYYAGEGIGLSARERSKRMLGVWVLSLLAVICALLLASDKSLLSFSLITGFFGWFFGLFRRSPRPAEQITEAENYNSMEMDLPRMFPPEESAVPSIWELLLRYGAIILKYGAIIFLAGAFILFMLSPLLNRGGSSPDKAAFFRRLGRMIAELFKGIVNVLVSFVAYIKNDKVAFKLRKPDVKEIRLTTETLLNAYSPAKKRDMRQSVTLFARLIIWGGEVRNVAWRPVYAPGEYCAVLASAEDSPHNGEIIRCGELFEQALYSAEVLSDAERKEFKELVETITA